jgi:hypothetical protein
VRGSLEVSGLRSTGLRTAGLALLAGAAVTFVLYEAGAAEDLYRWLYHRLLSGLDVPRDPSEGTVDAIRYTELSGAILQLVAGVVLLVIDFRRRGRPPSGAAPRPSSPRRESRSR